MLAPASHAGSKKRTRGFGPASRCPRGEADQPLRPEKVRRPKGRDRSARSTLCGEGARPPEVRGDAPGPCPDAGEGRVLTCRLEGAATLAARGAGVGHTSTYSISKHET